MPRIAHDQRVGTLGGLGTPRPATGARRTGTSSASRRSLAFLVVLALVVVAGMLAGSALIAADSSHLTDELALIVYGTYLAAAPVLVGLVWRIRRADSPIGPLLMLFGLSAWTQVLQISDDPVLFSIGAVLGQSVVLAWTLYLALAFPVGRLRDRADRWAMALLALAILGYLVWASQAPRLEGGLLARCFVLCPPNPFQVGESAWLSSVAGNFALLAGLAAVIGVVAIAAWRLRASRPRGVSLPVVVTSLLFLGTLASFSVARVSIAANGSIDEVIGWALLPIALAFPIAFLVDLIRTESAAQATVRRLLDRLVSPGAASWRDALADALGDPGLRLATWDARTSTYRDACGCQVEPIAPAGEQAWIEVHRGDEPVAAILADRRALEDPQVVATAANATLVATELEVAQREADTLRDAIADAAASARAELGRDLHDSAQQRLIALRIHIGLAKERLGGAEVRRELDAIASEVEAALADIRSVAHLDGPPALREYGLPEALRTATATAGIRVSIDASPMPRATAEVERAVYYTCLEAVQNAAKHAGQGASVRIRLASRGDGLAFTVTDDGIGLAGDPNSGAGLEIMRARVRAVGGWLRIHTGPSRGTSVVGRVPLGGRTASSEPG